MKGKGRAGKGERKEKKKKRGFGNFRRISSGAGAWARRVGGACGGRGLAGEAGRRRGAGRPESRRMAEGAFSLAPSPGQLQPLEGAGAL